MGNRGVYGNHGYPPRGEVVMNALNFFFTLIYTLISPLTSGIYRVSLIAVVLVSAVIIGAFLLVKRAYKVFFRRKT
jgi:hypothetical protein